MFDHNGDGIQSATGWLDSSDAWLVDDIGSDGIIASGKELFGVDTEITVNGVTRKATSGFEALAALDANGDKVFDANDAAFARVRLWQDLNQNGVSDAGELSTLADKGITSISLNYISTDTNLGNGNSVTGSAVVTRNTGSSEIDSVAVAEDSAAYNLSLAENPFYSTLTPIESLNLEVLGLPDMNGSGLVRDLREAMSLGTTVASNLQVTVTQFAQATTRDAQMALIDQLVQQWGATSTLTTSSPFIPGASDEFTLINPSDPLAQKIQIFAQQNPTLYHSIITLEQFNGATGLNQLITRWGSTLPTRVVTFLESAYTALCDSTYGALALQTRLQPYLDSIDLAIDADSIHFDNDALTTKFDAYKGIDERNALIDLVELNRYAQSTLNEVGWDGIGKLRNWVDALAVDSPLRATLTSLRVQTWAVTTGSANGDIFLGDAAADNYSAGDGADIVAGGAGNDVLYGQAGDDTLDGGAGNDNLSGGNGADTYLFGKGSGQDTISNYDSDALGVNADTILLTGGISDTAVTLTRSGDDLLISINGTDDRLRVSSYFYADATSAYAVENIKFSDGHVWDIATVKEKVLISTVGNDSLCGYATNDTLNGGEGNDTIYSYAGKDLLDGGYGNDSLDGGDDADTLYGGAGSDTLYGGNGDDSLQGNDNKDTLSGDAGNDTLDGGAGNDFLSGGNGADTYLFGADSGQDTISNDDGDAVGVNADTILLSAGITTADVTLTRTSDDLIISLNGTNDSLRVSSYFNTDGAATYAVENLKFADNTTWDVATVKTKVQAGSDGNDTLYGYATADTLSSGLGNDTVYGNAGNDQLDGDDGDDNLGGGDDDDTLYGGIGNDKLWGGNGEDYLLGNDNDDTLYGGAGNDTLDGGTGNDSLKGDDGADTYLFGRGSGQDTISNFDSDIVGVNADTILLGTGVTTADVSLIRTGDDLIAIINGTDDSLRVSSYFNADGAGADVVEYIKFADDTVWNVATVKAKVQLSSDGNDALYGYATNDTLSGDEGSDTIYGYAGNDQLDGGYGNDSIDGGNDADTLYGGAGRDTLYGGNGDDSLQGNNDNDTLAGDAGNDTLDGGAGNDSLSGGNGADTYLFGLGSGQDTINNKDNDAVGTNADTILLGSGINPTDVTLTRSNDDLILAITGKDDKLQVSDYFKSDGTTTYVVENIKFANDTVWGYATVKGKLSTTENLPDFRLNGTGDGESLIGTEGTDVISGNGGDDTLDGGAGADFLYGDSGNDTYVFDKGYGKDKVLDYDDIGGNNDVVLFGPGIAVSDVTVTRSYADLLLSIKDSADSLKISYYFWGDYSTEPTYDNYRVEQIKFADNTIWDVNTIKTMALNATAGNDFIFGYMTGDTITGLAGDDTVTALSGNDVIDGGLGNDSLEGDDGDDTIHGGAQDDSLLGGAGADSLLGDAGNDTLDGGTENDTLNGGAGNDSLYGGTGNDTFVFERGNGKDTVYAYDSTPGKNDVVLFGAGIAVADVTAIRKYSDLLLSIKGSSDSLRVSNYFKDDATSGDQVEQIKFADDTIWDVNMIKAKVMSVTSDNDTLTGYATGDTITGLAGDDVIYGMSGNDDIDGGLGSDYLIGDDGDDTIHGGAQNDYISGEIGADSLLGDAGDDTLYGGADNDTLDGGTGNDYLNGGDGNDTFVFAKGGGKDTIASDYDTSLTKFNILQIADDISAGELRFERNSNDLLISRAGTSDSITVSQFFYNNDVNNAYNPIQQIQFAKDGVSWNATTIQQLVNATTVSNASTGTAASDKMYGPANSDTLSGLDGTDFLFGGDGDDELSGNADADWLFGGNGADTLDGGTGADTMVGGRNDDYYIVDSADDVIIEHAYADDFNSYDQIESSVGYIVPDNVEAITLTGSTDINATANNNGCDMNGNAGNNYLKGGDGLDFIFGDEGVDTLEGGAGDDYYYLTSNEDTVIEQAGGGLDQIWAYGDGIRMADNVERLYMQSYLARTAYGNNSNNVMGGNNRANTLYGNGGNDRLFGYNGDDTLYGGLGNDSLYGSVGNDVYHFQRGDGQDLISDYDTTVGAKDRLVFDGAVDSSQIWLARSGNDLVLSIIGTSDKVTIGSWYVGDESKVESITASGNGKSLDYTKVDALVNAMAGFTPPAAGQTTLPQTYQDQLAGVMASSWS